MRETYTRTVFIKNLPEHEIIIRLFKKSRYDMEAEDFAEDEGKRMSYTGIKSWTLVTDEDAKELEEDVSADCIDEYHEYLILEHEDGYTMTFRNSHVEMHIR